MTKKLNQIYFFQDGTMIDLNSVIVIGAISKDNSNNIFIPVYCRGYNKPISIILANCIGTASKEQKARIELIYNNFTSEWIEFKLHYPIK